MGMAHLVKGQVHEVGSLSLSTEQATIMVHMRSSGLVCGKCNPGPAMDPACLKSHSAFKNNLLL